MEGTLEGFFPQLRGVAHWADVAGADHNSFSDRQLAAELAPAGIVLDPVLLQLGTLTPERTLEITTTMLDAFFGQWLQGRPMELFTSPPFAELSVRRRPYETRGGLLRRHPGFIGSTHWGPDSRRRTVCCVS